MLSFGGWPDREHRNVSIMGTEPAAKEDISGRNLLLFGGLITAAVVGFNVAANKMEAASKRVRASTLPRGRMRAGSVTPLPLP